MIPGMSRTSTCASGLSQHVLVPLALLAFWVALIGSMVEFWSR
jgi:hypothetical protein